MGEKIFKRRRQEAGYKVGEDPIKDRKYFKALNFKMVRGSRINTGVRNVCIGARKYYRELKRA